MPTQRREAPRTTSASLKSSPTQMPAGEPKSQEHVLAQRPIDAGRLWVALLNGRIVGAAIESAAVRNLTRVGEVSAAACHYTTSRRDVPPTRPLLHLSPLAGKATLLSIPGLPEISLPTLPEPPDEWFPLRPDPFTAEQLDALGQWMGISWREFDELYERMMILEQYALPYEVRLLWEALWRYEEQIHTRRFRPPELLSPTEKAEMALVWIILRILAAALRVALARAGIRPT